MADKPGGVRPFSRQPFPPSRRFILGALRAGRKAAPMTALVQIDVTEAWARLEGEDLSPTAFIMACVGRAVATHPEVHAYRDWLGRLIVHDHVDIAVMVEIDTDGGLYPLAHPVLNTDVRTVTQISDELRRTKTDPASGGSGKLLLRWGDRMARVPGLVSLTYRVAQRSPRVRSGIGTVVVTSVGMLLGGGGFALSAPGIATLSVVVGGVSTRPWVVDGEIMARRILDLAAHVDHRMVDGAPAARFGATLRTLLENPDLVDW